MQMSGAAALALFLGLLLAVALLLATRKRRMVRRVLILGVDGCRADMLQPELAPTMLSLRGGSPIPNARTSFICISAPGWTSCLTGMWPYRHGALDNDFAGFSAKKTPTLFHRLEAAGVPTFIVASWKGITDWLGSGTCHEDRDDLTVDHLCRVIRGLSRDKKDGNKANGLAGKVEPEEKKTFQKETDGVSSPALVATASGEDARAMFVHIDAVDHAGHDHGFDPAQPAYRAAVKSVDDMIARILQEVDDHLLRVKSTGQRDEDWLIVLTTDHGGGVQFYNDHKDNNPDVRNIFVFAQRRSTTVISAAPSSPVPAATAAAVCHSIRSTRSGLCYGDVYMPATSEIVDVAVLALSHLRFPELPALLASNALDGTLEKRPHADREDYKIWW